MFLRIIFFFVALLSISVTAHAQSEVSRASRTWDVAGYDIKVTLPPTASDRTIGFSAKLSLKNISPSTASSLTLRISPTAEVSAVRVAGTQTDFAKTEEKTGTGSLQRIGIRGVTTASGGELKIEVDYRMKLDQNSGLASTSPLGAQFLPLSFWYPTPTSWFFSRGADQGRISIEIAGLGAKKLVAPGIVSDNRAVEQKLLGQPFFLTGDFVTVQAPGVEVFLSRGATEAERRRAGAIAALASEAQKYFSNLMGPDGVAPLKIVAVRRGGGFSGGGVVLLDEGVFRRPKTDSQTAVVLSDAVAKIWLGNAARVSGDGYGVIREGLPRFLATEFIESRFGKDVADIERLRQRVAYGTVSRRDGTVTQISPLDDFYFTSMTNKGATIWRKLALDVGRDRLFRVLRSTIESGTVDLSGIRDALPEQKPFLDYAFDQVTDGNFLIGIPRREGNVSKVALRNTGPLAQTVKVVARTEAGETLSAFTTVEPKSFSEVVFESASPVVVAEVDPEKLQLQADYSDDVAPRQFSENDLVLLVKSSFDKQDFATAERDARAVLAAFPRFDDVRVLLARTLLAAGRTNEAEAQYRILQDEKLPSSRTIAWTYAGLGDIANQNSKPTEAAANYVDAILADADLGATITARRGSAKLTSKIPDVSLKEFFTRFDRAVLSNNKAEVDALILSGEMVRFSKGIAGQAQEWTSTILQTIELSSDYVSVEIGLAIRLLNKNSESGSAVMRLVKIEGSWKILSIDSFEVR